MNSCQHCQPLVLDYLYGLLEEPEAGAVEAHLRECATCGAVRDEAARLQGLFARAAKTSFPQVRFDPATLNPFPATAPKSSTPTLSIGAQVSVTSEPAAVATGQLPAMSSSFRGKSSRMGLWVAWAVAASVLVAIPSIAIPVLGTLNRAERAGQDTGNSVALANAAGEEMKLATNAERKQRSEAELRLNDARQIQESLLVSWVAEEKTVIQNQTTRNMPVNVFKPVSPQPWEPNDFVLVLRDQALSPHTRLVAEVRDQTDAVIYSQRLPEQRDNNYKLHLPVEAWTRLTPQSELFLVVSSEDEKTGSITRLQEKVRLFGPVYATMLATDRPVYRPGETVYFRSLTLDRVTFQPPGHEQFFKYDLLNSQHSIIHRCLVGGSDLVRVRDGVVEPIPGPDGKPIRGVGCGAFSLPADLKDGEYILRLTELPHPAGYPPTIQNAVTKTIKVRGGSSDEYAKQIGYYAASYSAGDVVEAWAELKFQDQPVPNAEVKVLALADQAQLRDISAPATGQDGRTKFRFTLPRTLQQGDVRLKVTFTVKDKNAEESIVEPVPVVGRSLKIEFFPEGGTLVAGVPSRVYVRATTPAGQPVDIRGNITDGRKTLARVETLTDPDQPGANRGIGSFNYTPVLGTPAWLKLESPREAFSPLLDGPFPIAPSIVSGAPAVLGTRLGFELPNPEVDGVVMSVLNPVSTPGEPIHVHLNSKGLPRNLIVAAYSRGRLSDTKRISTQPGQAAAVELLSTPEPRGGVVRITVFEELADQENGSGKTKPDIKPLAERLVFRKPAEGLKLSFTTNGTHALGESFAANSPVDLSIKATDEKGNPTAAIVWAAAVKTGSAPGKRDRLVTTHFLIAGEVNSPDGLEHADFLLTDHPNAAESLDLVLATQGWRRFVEQNHPKFGASRGLAGLDKAKSQVNHTQSLIQADQPGTRERRKLYDTYWPRYRDASKAVATAQEACNTLVVDKRLENRIKDLMVTAQRAQQEAIVADAHAEEASRSIVSLRSAGWYGVAGFGLLAVMLGALAWCQPLGRLPYGIGTFGSVALVAFLVITLGMAERAHAAIVAHHESIAKADQVVIPQSSETEVLGRGVQPLGNKASESLGKGADAVASSSVKNDAGPSLKPTTQPPSPPGGPSTSAMITPKSLGPSQPPGAMPQPGRIAPPNPEPPASAVPGGIGGHGFGGAMPKDLNGIKPAVAGAGFSGATGLDGSGNWQSNEARKNNHDFDLTERRASRSGMTPQLRSAGEAAASTNMKRIEERDRKNLSDREHEIEEQDKLKRRGAELELKQNGLPDPQVPMKAAMMPMSPEALALRRVKAAVQTHPPLIVREYAAQRPGTEGVGEELSDTILWQPVIVIPSNGQSRLSFSLGSAKGGYEIVVAGHTLDGRIGAIRGVIGISPPFAPALRPVTVPPKLP